MYWLPIVWSETNFLSKVINSAEVKTLASSWKEELRAIVNGVYLDI